MPPQYRNDPDILFPLIGKEFSMKLVIAEPLAVPASQIETLSHDFKERGWTIESYEARPKDQAELGHRLQDADAAVIANYPLRKEALDMAEKLQYLCIAFTGTDHVDINQCREKKISVSNCAGYSTEAVAELVFGMALGLYRFLKTADLRTRECGTSQGLMGMELSGKRFGIIGTGAIGRRTAAIASAFGCDVWGYNRTPKDESIHYSDLDTVLATSDIISIHLPLTEETRGLISAEKLQLMKPTAILINTARGPVIDNTALARALREGTIAGAAIDVYETEPPLPKDHPLLTAPHCLLSPHIGFFSAEAMQKRAAIVFDNLKAWENGKQKNVIC